jgi:hypothetical protein
MPKGTPINRVPMMERLRRALVKIERGSKQPNESVDSQKRNNASRYLDV